MQHFIWVTCYFNCHFLWFRSLSFPNFPHNSLAVPSACHLKNFPFQLGGQGVLSLTFALITHHLTYKFSSYFCAHVSQTDPFLQSLYDLSRIKSSLVSWRNSYQLKPRMNKKKPLGTCQHRFMKLK